MRNIFVRRPDVPAPMYPDTAGTLSTYPPISDYGIIGDGRSIALISRFGSIDWWCLPTFDGDPVFARLLDVRYGGFFSIQPQVRFEASRRYLDDTNILVTDFTTPNGHVRVLDFMPGLTEEQKHTYPVPFRQIVRRIEGVNGRIPLRMELRARPHFGRTTPLVHTMPANRYGISWGTDALHLASSCQLAIDRGRIIGEFIVEPGDRIDFALAYSEESPADLPIVRNLDMVQRLTEAFWQRWVRLNTYRGPYIEAVRQSALALKLLSYAPSGAIIAAATTSLPESIGGSRNWDYRYCWPRDAAFTIRALLRLGYTLEAHAFAEWLLHSTRITHPALQVLYDIYGDHAPPEHVIAHLEGYRASRPVRIGNQARQQFQLDVYGEVLDAFALYRRSGGSFDHDARLLISGAARIVMKRWIEPDDGIWEVRMQRQQHIHSKVMAWVALERTLELSRTMQLSLDLTKVSSVRDAIKRWVFDNGFNPELNAFVRTPNTRDLDAALLVIPLVEFLPGSDPRVIGTVDAIHKYLSHDEFVHRYLGSDGLPGNEGAFLICSFWLVEALARTGRLDEAVALFDRLLSHRNDLGLLSEEIDPKTRQLLGNFPQAFSHIGLINAALTLTDYMR